MEKTFDTMLFEVLPTETPRPVCRAGVPRAPARCPLSGFGCALQGPPGRAPVGGVSGRGVDAGGGRALCSQTGNARGHPSPARSAALFSAGEEWCSKAAFLSRFSCSFTRLSHFLFAALICYSLLSRHRSLLASGPRTNLSFSNYVVFYTCLHVTQPLSELKPSVSLQSSQSSPPGNLRCLPLLRAGETQSHHGAAGGAAAPRARRQW